MAKTNQNAQEHGEPAANASKAPAVGTPNGDAGPPGETAAVPRFRVVALGASAGGLGALTEFMKAMTSDSGMAFVVISHLDPEHKSALAEILSRTSVMPVREVEDGTVLARNHVYVIPPNTELSIARGVLHLAPRTEGHVPQMPVDTFFRSLAKECGSYAVGVVLSGTGTDGTLGLKRIKEEGGLTFAQDDSAAYTGMPHSAIVASAVDAVLPAAQIAAELLRISQRLPVPIAPEAPPPAEQEAFSQIVQLLSDVTGVDFVHYKRSTLLRRVERRMVLRRLPDFASYLQCLRDDAGERQVLFEEVLIPVTSFFREPESFEALKRIVLPRLLAERTPKTPLRIWVPGCSTGEEAYSLAICVLEYLNQAPAMLPIKIFATDISERAIETARNGAYGEGIAAEVGPERLQRFFLKTDRGYEVSKLVRDLCVFARQDVTRDPPFSQLDLISCRNVLIYLGSELQERVLPIFHYALRPGGVLMLGSSETVGSFVNLFEAIDKKQRLYARLPVPSRLTFDYAPGAPVRGPAVAESASDRSQGATDVLRDADRVVLARYAPSGVLVDRSLRVIQYRGDTGAYLKPPPGSPTTELLMMLREGLLAPLREALERAERDNVVVRTEGVRVKTNDHFLHVDLEVIPMGEPAAAARHFVILFEPAPPAAGGAPPAPRPRPAPSAEEQSEKDREIGRLNHDLAATKLYLQSVIEQKESANEQLRAANEEVVCANEELQSINEELTTAREELQATNEELTTVNDELQNRIQVANQLADDLVNLIDTTRIPIVVLGTDLCVRRFTPSAQALMNLRPGDIGRPVGELKTKINLPELEALVHDVIDTLEIKQREVPDETGAWHKLYVRPYKTLDHKVGGAVLMFIDINELKQREQEIKTSRDYAISIVETMREPLLVLDGRLCVRTANRAFYQAFGVTREQTEGRLIYELGNGQWNIPRLRSLLEEILPRDSHFEDVEVEHVFPTIGERTMLLNAHRLRQGEESMDHLIRLAIEDITVRKRAERLRRETEDRLRTMVDTAVDAIITIDEQGVINSINAATERMFGYDSAELIGQNVNVLMPPPYHDQHDDYLARYRQTGVRRIIGMGREVQGRHRNGTVFPIDLAVSEYEDRGQRMFSAMLHDLRARKALEYEVLHAATMEQQRIGQELHDTSAQELTALGLLADSLVATLEEESPVEVRIAAKIAEGIKRVLGQVRAYSRGLIRVEVAAEGLLPALQELAAHTTELHGVACTFVCKEPVEIANSQLATQLFSIAREAVTNALRHADAKNITISLESDGPFLTLRVQDDGVGLAGPPLDAKGMGLKIMSYRAKLIDAELSIGPAESGGAVVTCTCRKEPRDVSQPPRPA